jgi:hypothetical protein
MRFTFWVVAMTLVTTACTQSFVGQVPRELDKIQSASWTLSADAEAALRDALSAPGGAYAALAGCSALVEAYGDVQPYVWVRDDEARHVELILHQLSIYGVEPPEDPYANTVVAPEDMAEAAAMCAEAKRANVAVYDDVLRRVAGYPRLTRFFAHMREESSKSHLPLYEFAAEHGGIMTPEDMLAINVERQLGDPSLSRP